MHILITGANGQLGRALCRALDNGHRITAWQRPTYDISCPDIATQVSQLAPDVVINAAAWTNVDGAEHSPSDAYAVNALGPKYLAEGCAACGAAMVQVSTNEVFAGEPGRFYREYDQTCPASTYARSKEAGERAVRQLLSRLYIVRVAWLFGPGGNNFPRKIVAAADKHGALRVVDDEIGNPTYAPDVAAALGRLIESGRYGIYHLVNEGCCSRYELARTVLEQTGRGDVTLTPISLDDWPRAAKPPQHAVLINQAAAALNIVLRPWQEAVAEYARSTDFSRR